MRYFKLYLNVASLLSLFVFVPLASAETFLVLAEDFNNNSVISRNEWRGDDNSFYAQDTNRDNVITNDEARWTNLNSDNMVTSNEMNVAARWNQSNNQRNNDGGNWQNRAEGNFVKFDSNQDNMVSLAEWQRSSNIFARSDNNSDGKLNRSEFFAHPEVWGIAEPVQAPSSEPFRMMDRNNDNVISRYEWKGSYWEFDNLDTDHNGNLRVEEFHTPTALDNFQALDHNNNRFISRDEWHYSAESFGALDRNSDGRLNRDEFYNRTQARVAVFSELDINDDKRISRNEWRSDAAVFNSLDTNRDNVVMEAEFSPQGSASNVSSGSSSQQMMEQIFQQVFKNR